MGTAGFERDAVKGYNLVPAPPPKITAITDLDNVIIWSAYFKELYN